jgi:predicted Rossmann-fold nucleotide-binding protein
LLAEGRDNSFGLNIRLPFEQEPNVEIAGDPKLINFKHFFTPKLYFVKESEALVLFPGGFGTHHEGFEALTLMQTGKSTPKPVVFIDRPRGNYWKTWWRFVEDHLLGAGLISKEDFALLKVTDDVGEACDEITQFYRNYHSSRYVRDQLVLRIQHPVTEALLTTLNQLFPDLCVNGGKFAATAPLPEEDNEPGLAPLHRIIFPFHRTNFGRLRSLIDVLNHH